MLRAGSCRSVAQNRCSSPVAGRKGDDYLEVALRLVRRCSSRGHSHQFLHLVRGKLGCSCAPQLQRLLQQQLLSQDRLAVRIDFLQAGQ